MGVRVCMPGKERVCAFPAPRRHAVPGCSSQWKPGPLGPTPNTAAARPSQPCLGLTGSPEVPKIDKDPYPLQWGRRGDEHAQNSALVRTTVG